MQINLLKIRNFLSLGDVEIRPGKVTQIVGDNNQGKTSILKAISFAVDGSNDPSLVKLGEDSTEVLLELSDNTIIRRRLNSQGRQSVDVQRDGMKATSPQALLGALFDQSSFNPLDLLSAKERTEAILKSIDIPMTPALLAAEIGIPEADLPPLNYQEHGLKVLDAAHRYFYQRRAEANKTAAEKKQRWETYHKDLPTAKPAPPLTRAEIQVEKNERNEMIRHEEQKLRDIDRMHEAAAAGQDKVKKYVAAAAKIDEEVHELESKLMAAKARRSEADKFIESARQDVQTDFPPKEPIQKNITAMKQEVQEYDLMVKEWDAVDAIAGQVKMVEDCVTEFHRATKAAEKLTAIVDLLHGPVKAKIMENAEMPVKGLEFKDGTFTVKGVAVDNLSTSATLKLAIAVARKLAKKTKIICIDGAEQLDGHTWQEFMAEIKDDGFSYFVTKVGGAHVDPNGTVVPMKSGQVMQ
jgi:DNA repair ATPase RecN